MMRRLAFAICLLAAPFTSLSQGMTAQRRASFSDSLGALARAKTISQLKAQFLHGPKDFPHRAVYAALYFKFGGADRDAVLLNAMPSRGSEMDALYVAEDTGQGQDMAVTDARNDFYSDLSQAVARNPYKLPQFLRMIHAFHFVDNVDEWPWLCGFASKIYEVNHVHYLNAVRQIEPEFRREALDCEEPPDSP